MQVEVKSGPAEIIASGTAIQFNQEPIEITFGGNEEKLKIVFIFKDEQGKESESRMSATNPSTSELEITLFNANNPLGSGLKKPVQIGTLSGRELFLQFRVYGLPKVDKTVHYCIYLGEELNNQ